MDFDFKIEKCVFDSKNSTKFQTPLAKLICENLEFAN
jgi:hypothetical protein